MDRLQGKRALVTGGTSGIGLETAHQFLAEGAHVAVTGASPATIEAARVNLGADVTVIRADAGDVASQQSIAAAIREAFGGPDILSINAGLADFRPPTHWDEADFDRSVAMNLKGPFFLIQALPPVLANPASIVLDQRPDRQAVLERPCRRDQGRARLACAYAFRRADRAQDPRQCGQPRPDRDPAPRQAGPGRCRARRTGGADPGRS